MNKFRALCIAEHFIFDSLYENICDHTHAALMRDVIILTPEEGVFAYVFDFGVCVLCNYDYEAEKRLIDLLRKHSHRPLDPFLEEELAYQQSEEPGIKIRHDLIDIDVTHELACLAMAYAMAQSTKLAFFEGSIEKTIEKTKYIPETLAQKGVISLSRRALAKERGRVYLEKSHIILQFNLLDTPEFIWEYPELEPYYLSLSRYLEIDPRVTVLRNRLEVIQELLEMMADEQKHSHSSMLEWIIIILIAIEIGLFFIK